jgi:hypothetical protein
MFLEESSVTAAAIHQEAGSLRFGPRLHQQAGQPRDPAHGIILAGSSPVQNRRGCAPALGVEKVVAPDEFYPERLSSPGSPS